jgi:hypothetical protein
MALCEVANLLGISFVSVQSIFNDKQPEKWNSGNWFLHYERASSCSALSVHEFLAERK